MTMTDGHTRGAKGHAPTVWFWLGMAAGWSVMAYGAWGFISDVGRPRQTAWWVIGTAVAHDALFAPAVALVGIALVAVLPRWARGPIGCALAASVVVLAFSYPLIRHFGRRTDNPSILPLDYPRNVAIVVSLIWVIALLVLARGFRRRGRRPSG
jgi:hypothetical protein